MAQLIKQLLDQIIPSENQQWKIYLLKHWNTIVGDLNKHIFLEKIYQDEMLIIGVYDTSWMQELYLLSSLLIKKVNESLGKQYITSIRFKYSPARKEFFTYEKLKSSKKNIAPIVLSMQEYKMLELIEDPHLKEALKNFRIRCLRES